MKINNHGTGFIKREEGEMLTDYLNVAEIPTIGVGHTVSVDGVPVKKR